MNIHEVNQFAATLISAGVAVISDNVFEIIGAAGVIINLMFVWKSYIDKKRLNGIESDNKLLEQKILQGKLDLMNKAS